MNVKSMKKGFTLTELIIVIVIIGILAGVLIPTFINVVNKANKAADLSLIRNLNEALTLDKYDNGEHKNMTQALEAVDDYGFGVAKIDAKVSKNKILWDSKNDVFCYLTEDGLEYYPKSVESGEEIVPDGALAYKLWIIDDEVPSGSKFSVYYTGEETSVIVNNVGFDAGESNVTVIEYKGDKGRDVVIRTNGGTLIVNAPLDTVIHYGEADLVDIQKVASASYHENGTVSLVKVANGRVALESESNVGAIHLAATDGEFDNITVAKANGVEMPDFSRDPVEIPAIGKKVVALQEGTADANAHKDYVWLTAVGIYEQVTLGTENTAGTKYAATSESATQEQKTAAQQIANNITATYAEKEYEVKAVKNGDNWEYQLVNKTETITQNVTVEVTVQNNNATASVTVGETQATASTSNSAVVTEDNIESVVAHGASKTFAEIDSKEKLLAFRDAWNAGKLATGTFKLTANIDISGEDWLPIGTWEYPFNGTIDGNNKTIYGLTKTRIGNDEVYSTGTSTKYNGIVFGFIAIAGGGDVEVKNLTLSNVNISLSSAANSGALIGYIPAHDDFTSNSKGGEYWSETETSGKKVLPVNYGTDDVTLTNVSVSGSISAKQHIGGLIGKAYNTGDISVTDCSFIGDVTISATTGGAAGIIGWPSGYSTITVKGCTVEGNIKGGTPNKGTLVGRLDSISKNTVLDRNTTSNAHVLDANDVEVPQNLTVNYEYNSDGSVKTVTVNGTSIPYNTQVYENCVVSINTGTYYTLTDCEVYNSAFTSYVDIYGSISFDGCSFIYFNRAGNTSPKFDQPWTVSLTNTNMTSYTFRVKNGQNLTLNNNVKFTFKPNASGNTDYSVSGSNNTEKQANSYHVRVCNGGYLTLNSSYSYETVANTTAYYTNYNVNEDNGFLVYLEVGSIFNSETVTEAHFIWVKAK